MKPAKQLWRISVITTAEAEDAVTKLLGSLLERPASSCFNVKTGLNAVSAFCEQRPGVKVHKNISAGLKRIKNCGLKIGTGKITAARIRREDWMESWKRHFKPLEIGDALLVKPSWSGRRPGKNQAVVVLDPGLSFGTGQHPTTAFCLEELVRLKNGERARLGCSSTRLASNLQADGRGVRQNTRGRVCSQSFLDLGTGSGILAIAAAKLGYQPVRAIDFDPEAVRVARANARVNRVHNKLRIMRGDVAKLPFRAGRQYDLICANLISNLLMAERRRIVAQLKSNGTLVLAGILKTEFAQVQRVFEKLGLKLVSSECRGEWRSGSFFHQKIFLNEILIEKSDDLRHD